VTPVRADRSHQARGKTGYERDAFTIDFDHKRAVCPQNAVSSTWNETRYKSEDVIVVTFPAGTCTPCPVRQQCTTSTQRRRQLTLRPRRLHETLQHARAEQTTNTWKQRYRARAGIEGTISQAVALTGIRKARYAGIGKVHLEHNFAAIAVNLARLDAWWTGTPLQRTRTTHLARVHRHVRQDRPRLGTRLRRRPARRAARRRRPATRPVPRRGADRRRHRGRALPRRTRPTPDLTPLTTRRKIMKHE